MSERTVFCKKLGKELPAMTRKPYKNELGQLIYDQISKEAWDNWCKDSVKFINTYKVDLTSNEGQKFMFKQAAVYFGFEDGEMAQTAWRPADAATGETAAPAAEPAK
jgi:Fe-S cluster biosynthesis and repair protein YggX